MAGQNNVPGWLLGKHLTSLLVTGVNADASGLTSDGSASFSLLATIDSVRVLLNPSLEDIAPVTTGFANNVLVYDDASLVLTQILRSATGAQNELALIAANFDYARFTFTRGPQNYAGTFVRGAFEDGVTARGKNTVSLTIHRCNLVSGTSFSYS